MYQPLAECGDYILNLYVEQEGELIPYCLYNLVNYSGFWF